MNPLNPLSSLEFVHNILFALGRSLPLQLHLVETGLGTGGGGQGAGVDAGAQGGGLAGQDGGQQS